MRKGEGWWYPWPLVKRINVHQGSTINQEESAQNDILFHTMIKYNFGTIDFLFFCFNFVFALFYVH
jgi:hypothetical protein